MFEGSLPALVTPMKRGEIDFNVIQDLVEWHISQGSNGLVPVGTTGESPTLSHDEHNKVVECVVKTAAGRIPIIAGAGSNNTAETVQLVEHAKLAGADAALVVTPYYNKPTQHGMIQHFSAAEKCGLPIIIYNIPPRSVVDMTPETMGDLAKLPNIIGVKDATGDVARVSLQRISCGTDFIQLSGEDASAIGFNAQGGVGCITVTGNVAPRLCSQMQKATLVGDFKKALEYQDLLMPLHDAIFAEPGVAGAKYGLSVLGKCPQEVRSPLTELTSKTKKLIENAMKHAGL